MNHPIFTLIIDIVDKFELCTTAGDRLFVNREMFESIMGSDKKFWFAFELDFFEGDP